MRPAPYCTTVRRVTDLAPAVRELVLDPPNPRLNFLPGQWISLHLPVGEKPPLVRAYTLAAAPAACGELTLCLDRYPDGLGSVYVYGLQPGEPVQFDGPLGRFVLPDTIQDMLWIARYTGIVPFRAMLQDLRTRPPAGTLTLLYEAPTSDDLIYRAEIEETAAACPWFTAQFHRNATLDTVPGVTTMTALSRIVGERQDLAPMVCGVGAFVRPMREFFTHRGYERRAVRCEAYD